MTHVIGNDKRNDTRFKDYAVRAGIIRQIHNSSMAPSTE